MPQVPLEQLPPTSRLWIFGASQPLNPQQQARLLEVVDGFLDGWKAHGSLLQSARELRDDHFLIVAVDPGVTTSGCSIDKLFGTLQGLEKDLGVSMVDSGRIFFRDTGGTVRSVERPQFRDLVARGEISPSTPVFDTTLEELGGLADKFEKPASQSWHARAFSIQESELAAR